MKREREIIQAMLTAVEEIKQLIEEKKFFRYHYVTGYAAHLRQLYDDFPEYSTILPLIALLHSTSGYLLTIENYDQLYLNWTEVKRKAYLENTLMKNLTSNMTFADTQVNYLINDLSKLLLKMYINKENKKDNNNPFV